MLHSSSTLTPAALRAWRGQVAATGKRLGLRTYLLQHRQGLLPRFATLYRQLRALPRQLRKALQRCWRVSLASAALLLTLQPGGAIEAADFTAGTAAELVTAINTANGTVEADTITLTADITLRAVDNSAFSSPNGLPVITSAITIAGQGHTIHRDSGAPEFRLLAVSNTGDLTLQDTTLSGGISYSLGGGIFNIGSLTLTNSTVSGNSATYRGGGIFNFFGSGLTLTNSTLSGNAAFSSGGIFNFGSVTLTNSTVSGNSAAFSRAFDDDPVGGGIGNGGRVTLTDSTVSGNAAAQSGGGIYNSGRLTLTNSTVSGNAAAQSGGGIGNSRRGTSLTLSRSLVAGNIAPTAAEVFIRSGTSFTATFNLLGHKGLTTAAALAGFTPDPSDILATSDGTTPTALADILDTTLQHNGGPTLTHNLVAGSPAIDTAGPTCDLTTDQRGAPRPFGSACDIGAVEFGSFPPLDCSHATASVSLPRKLGDRHRYPVKIVIPTDPKNTVTTTITSIFQDEPVINPTGQTCPDGVGVGTSVAKIRNERLLAGDGRVYHIGFTATDEAGASCTGEVKVCVPAKEGEACGDQGALFDSTVCPE